MRGYRVFGWILKGKKKIPYPIGFVMFFGIQWAKMVNLGMSQIPSKVLWAGLEQNGIGLILSSN